VPKDVVKHNHLVYIKIMVYCIVLLLLFFPVSLSAGEGITADSYLLVEEDTFNIITGKDYHTPLPLASTTKVITTVMAIEYLEGDEIMIPDSGVRKIPRSKLNLIPGREYSAMDLIKGTLIHSANDAAYTIASHIAGSEEDFAHLMTEKAREIGAYNTQFKNASGLYVEGQYTTCYDLALIFRYAMSNVKFKEIIATKYFTFQDKRRSVVYKNHNRFLFCFDATLGGKTGYTRASKYCYVGAFEKNGKVYILSILGSKDLWGDAKKILSTIYDELPSDKEIQKARATKASLVSYTKTKTKKTAVKKKTKVPAKSKKKTSTLNEA